MRRGRSCVLLEEEHLIEANEEVLLNKVMTRNNYTSDGIYTYSYIGYIFIILSFYYISEVAISLGTREPSIHLDHMNLYPHIYICGPALTFCCLWPLFLRHFFDIFIRIS